MFKNPECLMDMAMSETGKELGMLFFGLMIGSVIPGLPAPLNIIQPYLWVIFLIIAIVLFLKG